ncbi:MAG: CBS domain-containing protein [Rubellimicrobium sp.]|nr:CBS domain-containing protein [Rubellimicrobium sp.]
MLVHQILAGKPDQSVLTITEGATVAEAAAILSERRIGCLVVSPDGARVDGILSERDIVREVGRRGAPCLTDPVASIMTRRITSCTRSDSVEHLMGLMTEGRFRHLPVMDGDRLAGLVSIGDVVKARISQLAMEHDAMQDMIAGR